MVYFDKTTGLIIRKKDYNSKTDTSLVLKSISDNKQYDFFPSKCFQELIRYIEIGRSQRMSHLKKTLEYIIEDSGNPIAESSVYFYEFDYLKYPVISPTIFKGHDVKTADVFIAIAMMLKEMGYKRIFTLIYKDLYQKSKIPLKKFFTNKFSGIDGIPFELWELNI